MNIMLTLGCWGRSSNDFTSCSGVSNHILDMGKPSQRNNKIIDYLDNSFKLFDRPLYNNVHTAIWNIQDKFSEKGNPVFEPRYFKVMEAFCIEHVKCGVYLRLEIVEKEE